MAGTTARPDFVRTAHAAADFLAPFLGVRDPRIVVVPRPLPGSDRLGNYEHTQDVIHLDVSSSKRLPDSEWLHTIGEEVTHALHHSLRPELWATAHPTKAHCLEHMADPPAEFAQDLWRSILSTNLIEMVGFWGGLRFLRHSRGARAAREYAELWLPELVHWRVSTGLYLVDTFCGVHAESVCGDYRASPQEHAAKIEAAQPNSLPKDLNQFWDSLIHNIGYRLACDLFALEEERQSELLAFALSMNTIDEFHAQAKIAQE